MSLLQLYDALQAAAEWTFARSSGPGGQNVNKVNSKAVLSVPLDRLTLLSEHQRMLVAAKLSARLFDGALTVHVQDTRSQLENRELALRRLEALIRAAVVPQKTRRATKPTRASQERRITAKKVTARRKQGRTVSYDD
jgi:ribosome-associated protein